MLSTKENDAISYASLPCLCQEWIVTLLLPQFLCSPSDTSVRKFRLKIRHRGDLQLHGQFTSPSVNLLSPDTPLNGMEEREIMSWVLLCSFPRLATRAAEIPSTEQSAQRFSQWHWGLDPFCMVHRRVDLDYRKLELPHRASILGYQSSGCDSLWGKDCETGRRKGKADKKNKKAKWKGII